MASLAEAERWGLMSSRSPLRKHSINQYHLGVTRDGERRTGFVKRRKEIRRKYHKTFETLPTEEIVIDGDVIIIARGDRVDAYNLEVNRNNSISLNPI